MEQEKMRDLASATAARLAEQGLTMATAESCTGGWIAKLLTDIAGSSNWFECGFVTYSNRAKQHMLGVQSATLERHGAVSEAVVREMAAGAIRNSQADLAVAVSGVAGPGGGTPDKPVGTVWLAWARGADVRSRLVHLPGDRDGVRRQTVEQALQGVLDTIG